MIVRQKQYNQIRHEVDKIVEDHWWQNTNNCNGKFHAREAYRAYLIAERVAAEKAEQPKPKPATSARPTTTARPRQIDTTNDGGADRPGRLSPWD